MPLVDPAPGPCPVVPGYVLEELLGRGGTGEVWRARPRGSGPPVAVKVLRQGDPERQVREAGLLAELDHPHLVRLHQVVRRRTPAGEQVALVLDLLAGGSLAALLAARGRLRPGEVVTAVAPVAAALAHLHDRGVVHGDLSPGNVVFTAEGRPVLTDLGVARVLGEPGSGEVTPPYVDPVVARGGAAGPASDVFGVAAAAFHALTGIPPWNAAGAGTPSGSPPPARCPTCGCWPRVPRRSWWRSWSAGCPRTRTCGDRLRRSRWTCGTPAGPSGSCWPPPGSTPRRWAARAGSRGPS
ncbi:serine/threonine-protein kinase [Klenkia terrae]|uniref:serine/threonine-protein kinase n=1 Tax=Klenkia terrae TaxID=1052259 RepID=UPI0036186934